MNASAAARSVRFHFTLGGGLLFALAAGVPAGCGSSAAAKGCVPGQSIACAGTGACQGNQVCNAEGSGYGECLCGPGTGTGTDGGSQSFPQVGPYSGLLGADCTTAKDCRLGLECVTSASTVVNGEGPGAGMCLAECLVAHDFCAAVDATAQCVVLDDGGTATTEDDVAYCLPGCKLGKQPDSADKCRGRLDLVCTEGVTGSGSGYCRPSCRADIDCAPRFCDLGTGLCADSAPTGDPIGTTCDPNASKCAGGCIAQGNRVFRVQRGLRASSPQATSAEYVGCGNSAVPLDYYCAIGATTTSGPGDLGYCAKLCDCDADCATANAVCEPGADLMNKAGRPGFCAPPLATNGKPTLHIPCKS